MGQFKLGRFLIVFFAAVLVDLAAYYHGYSLKNLYLVPYDLQPILGAIAPWPWKTALFVLCFCSAYNLTASRAMRLTSNEFIPFFVFLILADLILSFALVFFNKAFALMHVPYFTAYSATFAFLLAVMVQGILKIELGFGGYIVVTLFAILASFGKALGLTAIFSVVPWYSIVAIPLAYYVAKEVE